MNKEKKFYWQLVLDKKAIPYVDDNHMLTSLKKLGFMFPDKISNAEMINAIFPKNWSTKSRWLVRDIDWDAIYAVNVRDGEQRTRIVISFSKWRNNMEKIPEIWITPRYELYTPTGCLNTNTTHVFIVDHAYDLQDSRRVIYDKEVHIQKGEEFCTGPTSLTIYSEALAWLENKFPHYEDGMAYWQ